MGRTPRLHPTVKEWVKIAQQFGWTVRYTANGHVQFRSPDKSVKPTTIPSRPGQINRGLLNSESQLRAAGFPFPLKTKEEARGVANDRDREAGSQTQRRQQDAVHDERRGEPNGSQPVDHQALAHAAGSPAAVEGSDGGQGEGGVLHTGRSEGTDPMVGDAQARPETAEQPLTPPATPDPKGTAMTGKREKVITRTLPEDVVRHATTDEYVVINDLLYDYSYQRPLNPKKVNALTRDFNFDAIGVIYVSRRADGTMYVIDGQHRLAALTAVGLGDEKIEAHVYEGLTVAEEAELWVYYNENRTKPRPVRLFLAKVVAGEEVPVAIAKVLAEHDTAVKEGSGYIQSPQSVIRIFTKGGRQLLGDTVSVVLDAWGKHDTAGMSAESLLAVARLLTMFPTLDRRRLARKMAEVSAHKALGDAKAGRLLITDDEGHHPSIAMMMARSFMMAYNKSLRSGKLRWDETAVWAYERSSKRRAGA